MSDCVASVISAFTDACTVVLEDGEVVIVIVDKMRSGSPAQADAGISQ